MPTSNTSPLFTYSGIPIDFNASTISEFFTTMRNTVVVRDTDTLDSENNTEDLKKLSDPKTIQKIGAKLEKYKVVSDKVINTLMDTIFYIIKQYNEALRNRFPGETRSVISSLWNTCWILKKLVLYREFKNSSIERILKTGLLGSNVATEMASMLRDIYARMSAENIRVSELPLTLEELIADPKNLASSDKSFEIKKAYIDTVIKEHPIEYPESSTARFATNEESRDFISYFTPQAILYIEALLVVSDRGSFTLFPEDDIERLSIVRLTKFFSQIENEHLSLQQASTLLLTFRHDFCENCLVSNTCQNMGTVFRCYKFVEIDRDLAQSLARVGRGV